jgi:tetratricopeptide (TPR) repeat protein
MEFRREYLVRLPLPLAQLYSRAHNAKDARTRHDNAFYLCEALIKLAATPLVACYLDELRQGRGRVPELDRLLAQLALPSLGQWLAMLRELARHIDSRPDAASHPLGHLWNQLSKSRRDLPGLVALYRRIKNGVDGQPAGDQSCSVMQTLDALVQYRNAVFGHGGPRFESFFEKEMGPLLFPAVNELLQEGVLDYLGPRGSRLAYLTEVRQVDEKRHEVGVRELVGLQSERQAPLALTAAQVQGLLPNRVCVLWAGRSVPLRLDPLLVYREAETAEEVLYLNRDRNGKQAEYLSYTTGRTERDKGMAPALAELLSRVCGREVDEADLEALAEQTVAGAASVEGLFEPAAPAGQTAGDYELLAEIGRGGMGVVYLARQMSLGRLVALKMLPGDLAGDETALARFHREIRQLAACDHPNIIKVLASGTFPDGRLYYAMEYIQGCDLDAVWRELAEKKHEGPASSLGQTTWSRAVVSSSRKQREQLLHRAEATKSGRADASVADTPASRDGARPLRPLRDLPLPPLPEVPVPVADEDSGGYVRRVADMVRQAALGLESVHQRHVVHRDIKPANLMLTADGARVVLMDFGLAKGDSVALTATRQGGFLGTLRYAAPEQLAASVVDVGPAADVRALGAVLWELLTRRRLFSEAQDEAQLAVKVMTEDVPLLRRVDPALERDLEAIVARATERDRTRRIQTAGELAEYLGLYLEGKPLPIRTPSAGEVVWRWVKGHKELVGMVAALLLLVVGGVAWGLWYQYDRQQREADEALREASQHRERALLNQQIRLALRQSEENREGDLRKVLRQPGGVQRLLNQPARWAGEIEESRAYCQRARALWESGRGRADAALLAQIEALEKLLDRDKRDYRLAVAVEKVRMDLATVVEGKQELDRAAAAYAGAFRRARLAVLADPPAQVAEAIKASDVPGQIVAALDHWAWITYALRRHALREKAAELAARLEAQWKQLLHVARLADPDQWEDKKLVRNPDVWSDAVNLKKLVVSLRQKLENEPRNVNVSPAMLELVASLLDTLDPERVRLLRAAEARYPADFRLNLLLGQALLNTRQPEEGVGYYRAALALRPKNPIVYNNFGLALRATRNPRAALAAYDEAIRIKPDYALVYTNKGNVLVDLKQLAPAVAAHRQAIELDPTLSLAHRNLGDALEAQNKLPEAVAAYQQAIKLDPNAYYPYFRLGILHARQRKYELAKSQFLKAAELQPRYAPAWDYLGWVALQEKNLPLAEQYLTRALEIDPPFAQAHRNLGLVCNQRKDWKGAAEHFRQAVKFRPGEVAYWLLLVDALKKQNDPAGAVAVCRQALEVHPKSALLQEGLGLAYKQMEYYKFATEAFRRATELDPKFSRAFSNLALMLREQKDLPGALAAFQKASDLNPKSPEALLNVGTILADQRKNAEATACYQKAIDLNPKFALGHNNLANALKRQGQFGQAIEHYQKAKQLGYNVGDAVGRCQRLLELDKRLPLIREGKTPPRDGAERILLAELCKDKGQFGEAAQFLEQAFAVEPKLADVSPNRYNAACYAVMAASLPESAARLDEPARAKLRRQALGWLQAEAAAWRKQFCADPAGKAAVIRAKTKHWLFDLDLTSAREPQELAKLPAEERPAWLEFWASVKALQMFAYTQVPTAK